MNQYKLLYQAKNKVRKEKLEEFAQSIRQKFDELAQKFK